jgi:hypothetical protein
MWNSRRPWSVEVQDFPSSCKGWVTIYPLGRSGTPDTRIWRDHRGLLEDTVCSALVAVAAPF